MSYTKEQEAIVLKVLSYKSHQFYEILSVKKTSEEGEIKRSYRKLAIKCHPDKNPHPRSSEAFKVVNKAWEVLSDPQKKTIFDQTGSDPTSRFSGVSNSSSSPFASGRSGFASAGRGGHNAFEEDIFNMFFGGGGQGPTFTFGGNGFTFQSFGGGQDPFMRHRRTARRTAPRPTQQSGDSPQPPQSLWEGLKGLFPILIILIVPILSALFSDDSTPDYSFTPSREYNIERRTPRHDIPFFVNDQFTKKYENKSRKQLRNYDVKVENLFIQDKRAKCSREQIRKDQLIEDAIGWFSTDTEKLKQAENMPMPNCDVLRALNLI
ncbi:HLJ1 [Candida pseudojiufengensis]|uniref:HLJ1 n=1 Tax=Candida pseudojiufengensis TaxID=497109 RepID=UPI002225B4ED|nr:HLJ1 [Candida pseudojiufengensis]KAI5959739.1 HLJ1 [Candida pseudojiufengensis]